MISDVVILDRIVFGITSRFDRDFNKKWDWQYIGGPAGARWIQEQYMNGHRAICIRAIRRPH
jgi:hypothetical protein